MAFELKGGVIDLQELMPLEDRTRPTLFYDWDKQHSGQVPVNSVEAAVDGPVYDLKAYLQSDKGASDGSPEVKYNGQPLGAGDVTPEIEQEWKTFLKVANDHFRLSMENLDYHKTDAGEGYEWMGGEGSVDFWFSTTDRPDVDGVQVPGGGGPRLTLRGLYRLGHTFVTGWDSTTNVLRVKDGQKSVKNVEVDVGDRIWDSLLEHGNSFATSHPAIQQRFPGVAEGSIRRESDGSYQLYDKAPTDGGQPISGKRYNSDFSPMGVDSGVSATPGAAGLPPTGAELLATTLAENTAQPSIEGSAPPVTDPTTMFNEATGTAVGSDDTRPVGEAVLGQGDTFYVDGAGAVELDENGVPRYNQSQMRDIFKSYLRTQIGSDHPGIDQFVDAYLGNETTAPRGAPPTNMRDWAIQQQLDRILRDKGVTSGDSTFSSEASSGGLASISDTGSVGSGLGGALGVLGDLGMGAGAGGLDLSAFINSLPGVGVGDLGLPDVGVGDLGLPGVGIQDLNLPDLSNLSFADMGGIAPDLSGLSFADMGGISPDLSGLSYADMGGTPPSLTADDVDISGLLSGLRSGIGGTQRLLDQLRIPSLEGLTGGIGGLEQRLSEMTLPSLSGLNTGVSGLEQQLNTLNIPSLDALSGGISGLQQQLGNLQMPDLSGLRGNIDALSAAAGGINIPSLAGLNTGVSSLEQQLNTLNIPTLDALSGGVSGLQQQLSNLQIPNFDALTSALGGVEGTVGGIQQQLGNLQIPSMPDLSGLSGIEGALSGLQQRIGNIQTPARPDWSGLTPQDFGLSSQWLGGMEGAVGGLEQRVNQLGLPDFSGTNLADLGLNLSAGDMGTALSSYFGGANPLAAINESLTQLLGKDFGGGDVFNEYVTNVEGGGGGAAFDPVAFGRGLAGSASAPHGYDYLNMGFLDLLKQAQAQGIVGPGIAGGGGLDPSALQSGLGQFFFGDDYAPTVGPGGVFDDLGFLGANNLDAFLNNQFTDFRTGLGLGEGQTLPGLIESLIPAQPQLDPMFTDPTQFFDQLTQALETAVTGQDYTFTGGTTKPTSWYSDDAATTTTGTTTTPETITMEQMPALDMPAINDFTDYLRYPLMEGLTGALGSANPFDTRRDAILKGPTSDLNRQFDESRENLVSRYGTMGMMGSPAFNQQMRELERDRAQGAANIASQFGMEAARSDETMRRNRLSDVASAMTGERQATRDDMMFQNNLQRQAQQDYNQYLAQQQAAYMGPQSYQDEGLRLALGGIGSNLQPAISSSLQSLAGIFAGAGDQISNNNNTLANAFGNKNGQKGLWG